MPNMFESFMRGQQAGIAHRQFQQQQQDRDSLRQLAPQVIAGDPAAYSQAAAISPEAAGKYADAGDAPYLRLRNAVQLVDRAKSTGNPVALKAALTQISPYIQQLTGKPGPTEWTPDMEPGWEQLKMRIAMADGGKSQLPTGFQEFDMKARAAGLRPGTPEYENAAKVALGVQGRAASGGYGFKEVEGPDGRTRMGRTNPRTGAFEIYDESTGEFVPQGGTAPINGGQGASAGLDAPGYGSAQLNGAPLYAAVGDLVSPLGGRITSTNGGQHNPGSVHQSGGAVDIGMGQETPEQQAKIMAALQGDPRFQVRDERSRPAGQQVWSGPHLHVEPRSAGLGVSRTKEEEARAVEQAKADIQYNNSGRMAEADANRAAMVTGAQKFAEAAADRQSVSATKTIDSQRTLSLLLEAERLLPMSTGSSVGNIYDSIAGAFGNATPGAQAIAGLQTIAGQLTSSMPRMQGPQSDKDVQLYKQMAGDLANPNIPVATRMAALQQIRRLNQKYAAGRQDMGAPSSPRPGAVEDGYRFKGGNPADPNSWERI